MLLLVHAGCAQPEPLRVYSSAAEDERPEGAKARNMGKDQGNEEDGGTAEESPASTGERPGMAMAGSAGRGSDAESAMGAGGQGAGGAGGSAAEQMALEPTAGTSSEAPTAGGATAPVTMSLVGFWGGIGVDSNGPTFDVCLRVDQSDTPGVAGHARYRGRGATRNVINCKTELSFLEVSGELFKFREVLTSGGGCFSPADIELKWNRDGTINFDWYRPGVTVPQEKATLSRVDDCTIK